MNFQSAAALVFLLSLNLAMPQSAWAAPFTNGSFEQVPQPATGGCGGGGSCDWSSGFAGWTVFQGNIDPIKTLWDPSEGSWSIDLNGNTAGGIRQSFDTIAGAHYELLFDLAGNPFGGPVIKTVHVDVGSASGDFAFNTTGRCAHVAAHCIRGMGWLTQSLLFTAASDLTTLAFRSTSDPNWYGPALDNVRILRLPVPEPKGLALALMGLAGMMVTRRRQRSWSNAKP